MGSREKPTGICNLF